MVVRLTYAKGHKNAFLKIKRQEGVEIVAKAFGYGADSFEI
jgi:hypothetical protein